MRVDAYRTFSFLYCPANSAGAFPFSSADFIAANSSAATAATATVTSSFPLSFASIFFLLKK